MTLSRLVEPERSRILIFGASEYVTADLPDVPAVANNLNDLQDLFLDPDLGRFTAETCSVAPANASIAEIGDLLLTAATEAEDLLLLYYSGHGLLGHKRRELYLSLAGTRPDRLPFTALAFEAVRDALLDSPAENRVIILDCCYSGRVIGEALADTTDEILGQIQIGGTYTLTSAPGNRAALILPDERNSAFTGRLLELLRKGSPGAGEHLTLGDIYRHLNAKFRAEGLPLPQQRGTETADLLGLVPNLALTVRRSTRSDKNGAGGSAHLASEAAIHRLGYIVSNGLGWILQPNQQDFGVDAYVHVLADEGPSASGRMFGLVIKSGSSFFQQPDARKGWRFRDKSDRLNYWLSHSLPIVIVLVDPEGRAFWQVISSQTVAEKDGWFSLTVPRDQPFDETAHDPLLALTTTRDRYDRLSEELAAANYTNRDRRAAERRIVKLLAASDFEGADREARNIPDPALRQDELMRVGEEWIAADPYRAEQMVLSLSYPSVQAELLRTLAAAFAPVDLDRAEQVASTAGPTWRPAVLRAVVEQLADTDVNQAERIAWTITDAQQQARSLLAVVRVLLDTNTERAEEIFQKIQHPGGTFDHALADIAIGSVSADPARAKRMAEKIANPDRKTSTLLRISEAGSG